MREHEISLTPANIGGPRGVGHFPDNVAFQRFEAAYAAAFEALPAAASRDVETSFGRVRTYRFADGPGTPLVLLSGSGAATPMWHLHLADLAALERPVLAIEPLGQAGASRQTRRITGAADQAQWTDEVLAEVCPEGAHLLGASMGGWLALQTALRAPGRLRSVVAVDPPAVFARLSLTFLALGLGSAVPFAPQALRRRMLDGITGLGRSDPDDPMTRLRTAAATDFRVRLPAPSGMSDEELGSIELPVLALIGGKGRVHDAARAGDRARLLPHGRVAVWEGAAHVLNVQFPDRFATAVRSFLSEVET